MRVTKIMHALLFGLISITSISISILGKESILSIDNIAFRGFFFFTSILSLMMVPHILELTKPPWEWFENA